MKDLDAWPEKQQKRPTPPSLPLAGEVTVWLALLAIDDKICRDSIG